jgi:hypothetical protein
MGYSHYFSQHRSLNPEEWEPLCHNLHRLLAALPLRSLSAGGFYADRPLRLADVEVTDGHIVFNGAGSHGGEDLGHETLVLFRRIEDAEREEPWRRGQRPLFQFCKTERKPYDLVVCALLILVGRFAPDAFTIGSDGDPADWQPALDWVRATVCPECELPFSKRPARACSG